MSYILEALKKSSEERRKRQQEEELQGPLLLDQAVSQKTPEKNRLLPLLLTIAFAVLSLLSWQFFSACDNDPVNDLNPEQESAVERGQEPESNATDGLQSDSGRTLEQAAPAEPEPGLKPESNTTDRLQSDSRKTLGQEPESNATDRLQSDGGKTLEQPAQAPSAAATKEETAQGVALFEELPLAIRAQLPEMKYSGHVFSPNPQLRMILINTAIVREGDLIGRDIRLVEITRNGLVMSYKGTTFKVALF